MTNPFTRFDKIYCINLDRRPDRWIKVYDEFRRAGIENLVERFPAFDMPDNPARGNHLSHAQCIKNAKNLGAKNVLIFEDDLQWLEDPLLLKRVPLDFEWDLLYLGVNTEQPCYQVDYHLAKLTFAYSTHAYAVNNTLFDRLIELNENPNTVHNDVEMSNHIIPNYNCYATIPLLAGQRKAFSDIMQRDMDSNPVFINRFNSNLVRKHFAVEEPTFCTFVIPTIGRTTLPRAVESVINQTDWNWRAVVMFDGMEPNYQTDNDHVKIVACDKQPHQGFVRNQALKYVTTDWIAFLDDDDWVTEDYITSLRRYADQYDVVIFTYKDVTNGNTQPPHHHREFIHCNVGISFAVRTDFVIRNNIAFPSHATEDYSFLDSCRKAGARYILTHEVKYFVGGIGGNQRK